MLFNRNDAAVLAFMLSGAVDGLERLYRKQLCFAGQCSFPEQREFFSRTKLIDKGIISMFSICHD
jgi:hypothetical protein